MQSKIKTAVREAGQYDDIYVLPVGKYFIIYSPLRGLCALSDSLTIQYLFDILYRNDPDNNKHKAVGFILKDVFNRPPYYPEDPADVPDPYFLGIIPTRACNGACIYCDFDTPGNNKRMDYQTVITAIDWMAGRMEQLGKDKLEIHFFGGEPLIAPDILSVAVHYAKMTARRKGLIPLFEVSTNGLVSDQTARFVTERSTLLYYLSMALKRSRIYSVPCGTERIALVLL